MPKTALVGRLAAAAMVSVVGLAANAQNALGDGTALDNSLSAQGPVNPQGRDLQAEIAFRNAIVTGNAANFQSFRGDVGYRAAGEFRGSLGSDELFTFRRDSLVSGLAGLGIRGTDALQYQFALSTGNRPPDGLVGGFSLGRDGFSVANRGAVAPPGGAESGGFLPKPSQVQSLRPLTPGEQEDRGTLLNSLRSPSAYATNQGFSQTFLGRFDLSAGNSLALTASELRAVRATPLAVDPDFGRMTAPEGEPDAGPTRAPDGRVDTAVPGTGGAAEALETRIVTANAGTAHAEILGAFPITTEVIDIDAVSPRARLEILRRRLTAPELFDPIGVDEPDEEDAEDAPGEAAAPQGPAISDRERALREQINTLEGEFLDTLTGLPRVERLISDERAENTAYGQHILAGERLLARARYFDAEERFVHALTLRRGDVTAQIGRVHAQLGAGLYMSAAINLRTLLVENPEVAAAKFAGDLLPEPERLAAVRADLETLIEEQPGTRMGLAAALLLGFIGYQSDDLPLIEKAFAIIDGDEARALEDTTDARLAGLLRRLWLAANESDEGSESEAGE